MRGLTLRNLSLSLTIISNEVLSSEFTSYHLNLPLYTSRIITTFKWYLRPQYGSKVRVEGCMNGWYINVCTMKWRFWR